MTKLKVNRPKIRRSWSINPSTRVKPSAKLYRRVKSRTTDDGQDKDWKDLHPIYRYCPACGAELAEKGVEGKKRKCCLVCGFVLYKNPAPASGVIIERDEKVLLVKRKYPPFKGDWSLPAGFIEYGESPRDCAIREVYEETGLEVELSSLFGVYSGQDDPRTHAVLVVYLAGDVKGELAAGDDAGEAEFFGEKEIPSNIAFSTQRQALKEYFDFKRRA